MKKCTTLSLGLALSVGTVGLVGWDDSARAADTAPSAPAPDNTYSKLARADSAFLVKAAQINGEQAAIARVATTRATAPEVRAFAEDLVVAHDAIGSSLARLAAAKTVTLGAVGTAALNQKWTEKKIADFDKDYVNEVAASKERAVSIYQEVIRDGKDTDITTLAREQSSALSDHLHKAEELQKLLK